MVATATPLSLRVNGLNVSLVGLSNVLLVFEGYFGSFSIAMVRLFGWPTVGAVKGRFSYLVPNEIAPHLGIPQSDRGGTAGAATSRAGRDDLRMALSAIWTGPDLGLVP